MSLKDKIEKEKLPRHVAIIMDGNGRWAKKQGNDVRLYGHQNAITAVREATEGAAELGIEYLTLYTFSTENWNRPKAEVDGLMALLVATIASETPTLLKNNVRLRVIGNNSLPADVQAKLDECLEATSSCTGLTLVLALSYSSRWEITRAMQNIAKDAASGRIKAEDITDETVSCYMATNFMPDPELLIRTSGEYRISNFLLWQIAYSELYFTPVLWPDFRKENLYEALVDFQGRERRFGKTSEQVQN